MSPSRRSDVDPTGPAPDGQAHDDVGDAVSYEQARDELADVVQRLEAGGLSLDDSLSLWERGESLARACQRFLDGARQRVQAALDTADAAADTPAEGATDEFDEGSGLR